MVLECRAESVFFSIHLHCVGLLLSPLLMSFLWLSLYFCCLWIFLPHMCFWNCLWETSGRPISRWSWFLSGYRCVFRIHVGRSRCQPAVRDLARCCSSLRYCVWSVSAILDICDALLIVSLSCQYIFCRVWYQYSRAWSLPKCCWHLISGCFHLSVTEMKKGQHTVLFCFHP